MINITHNANIFLEKNKDIPLIVYGSGDSGYWIGYYLNMCNYDWAFYIDKSVNGEGATLHGKNIFSPDKFKDYVGQSFRIIVASVQYQSVVYDLLKLTNKYNINIECFIPIYERKMFLKEETYYGEKYDINKFLAYFRRKLLKSQSISFVANNCIAGHFYEMAGILMSSPTINTGLTPEDFIKLCKSPQKYLNMDIKCDRMGFHNENNNESPNRLYPIGRLDDIEVHFVHEKTGQDAEDKWNTLRENVDFENLIFLLADNHTNGIPIRVQKEFMELPQRHLLVINGKTKYCTSSYDVIQNLPYASLDKALENYFDFVGWLNGD